jgi:hypothetical protein
MIRAAFVTTRHAGGGQADLELRYDGVACASATWAAAPPSRNYYDGRNLVAIAREAFRICGPSLVIACFCSTDYAQRADFLAQSVRFIVAAADRKWPAVARPHAVIRGAFIAPAAMKPGIRKSSLP